MFARLILFLLFCLHNVALAQSVFGRYVGTLSNSSLGREQFAKLDFVTYSTSSSQLELRAILTLHFGSFESREYASYHFDRVRYNLLTSELVFDQPDQDITFIVRQFNGSSLTAELRSSLAGNIGTLKLGKNAVASLTKGGIEALQGQYKGVCGGKENRLQIFTYRSARDTNRTGNPFPYDIYAQRGVIDPDFCGGDVVAGERTACVEATYNEGSYNFFTGELSLFGVPDAISCQVAGNKLSCGECTFTREKGFTLTTTSNVKPKATAPLWAASAQNTSITALSGEYTGFLHHESTNAYQAMSLNVVSFQDPTADGGSLRLSAVARLFFGQVNASESISYRFNERPFPILTPITSLVFYRPEADVDATLQITAITANEVRGVWNSLIYGRVGTFVARKGAGLVAPSGAQLFKSSKGEYRGQKFDLSLLVRLGEAPINSENPFAPLQFGGFVRLRDIGPNQRILSGTYDFFTGKIGFVFDETDQRVMVGTREGTQLRLARPSNGWNSLMQPFEPSAYQLN